MQTIIPGWLYDNVRLQTIVTLQCRELLMEGDLCALSLLTETMRLPFTKWLARERDKSAHIDTDWEIAFKKLHRTFNLPRAHASMGVELDDIPYREVFTLTQERLFKIGGLADIVKSLASSFEEAECFEYALLLQTLYCGVDRIVDILSREKNLTEPYFTLLHDKNK
jgi:hypothetical protein